MGGDADTSITLAPRWPGEEIAARSVAERYIAGLVHNCLEEISSFERDAALGATYAHENGERRSGSSTRSTCARDAREELPATATPAKPVGDATSCRPSGAQVEEKADIHRQIHDKRLEALVRGRPIDSAKRSVSASMRLRRLFDPQVRRLGPRCDSQRVSNRRQCTQRNAASGNDRALPLPHQHEESRRPRHRVGRAGSRLSSANASNSCANSKPKSESSGRRSTIRREPRVSEVPWESAFKGTEDDGGIACGTAMGYRSTRSVSSTSFRRRVTPLSSGVVRIPSDAATILAAASKGSARKLAPRRPPPPLPQHGNLKGTLVFRAAKMAAAMNQAQTSPLLQTIANVDGWPPAPRQNVGGQDMGHEDPPMEAFRVLETNVKETLKATYQNVKDCMQKTAGQLPNESGFFDRRELYQAADELKMSVDDVLLVRDVFDWFDRDSNGMLDVDESEEAILQLVRLHLKDQSVSRECIKPISLRDNYADDSGRVGFMQFLLWYSSSGLSEELLLPEGQRWLRKIAKENDLPFEYVQLIKRDFDSYDFDSSGYIDQAEFKEVLQKLLKIPPNCELPPTRIHYFWAQLNSDGSGKAGFEEFLRWYRKYFSEESSTDGSAPFQDFYKHVRFGRKSLDPPAYCPEAGDASQPPAAGAC
mmetsp:Transcript_104556/g.294632  ORF Transcript_104556/g.294632 Transcript_104556/m.294632 type:complete len:650 (-) Transcript_104556:29-1978(-)